MNSSGYISLSLASSLRDGLDIAANNMANANTAGFKAQRADFQALVQHNLGAPQSAERDVSFVINQGSYLDPTQGQLTRTGNPLDVALSGNAWFGYTTPTGQTAFGRDGRLNINSLGNLVTVTGAAVLDGSGSPISIPITTGDQISISDDGEISDQTGTTIAKLGTFSVPGIDGMQRLGGGLFANADGSTPALTPATDVKVSQGFVEESNVQPVIELTRMMEIQRAYERSLTLMDDENDLRKQTLSRLGSSV